MQRTIVAVLATLDAVVAALIGVALAFAPLTVIWFVAFGTPDLSAIWQSAASIWQLGHAVPLHIALPELYAAQIGIADDLTSFTISLAPLAFGVFTLLFAARSGRRAADAGAWLTGAITGILIFSAITAVVALTGAAPIVATETWQAVLFPAAFYAVGILSGAVHRAWSEGDDGPLDALRVRLDRTPGAWPESLSLVARGTAVVVAGIVGAAALVLAIALVVNGPQIVALSQASNLDLLGAITMAFGELLYLPTLVVWALAFVAGPGMTFGSGVVPGIPVLGVLPDATSPWMLLLALVPIGAGAAAGWAVRSRLSPRGSEADAESTGLLVTVTVGIALLAGAITVLLCVLASGSMGPGSLAAVGPDALAVGSVVAVEAAIGAGILMLSPRRR